MWQKAPSRDSTLLPCADSVTGACPQGAGSLSPGPAQRQPAAPLWGACPGCSLSQDCACPAAYWPAPGAAPLVLIQTLDAGNKLGALGSKSGVPIPGCFLRSIWPARLYPSLSSKPAEGHVLLHTFCLSAHIHAASPRKATPRYLLRCSILPQLTEKPF